MEEEERERQRLAEELQRREEERRSAEERERRQDDGVLGLTKAVGELVLEKRGFVAEACAPERRRKRGAGRAQKEVG